MGFVKIFNQRHLMDVLATYIGIKFVAVYSNIKQQQKTL